MLARDCVSPTCWTFGSLKSLGPFLPRLTSACVAGTGTGTGPAPRRLPPLPAPLPRPHHAYLLQEDSLRARHRALLRSHHEGFHPGGWVGCGGSGVGRCSPAPPTRSAEQRAVCWAHDSCTQCPHGRNASC